MVNLDSGPVFSIGLSEVALAVRDLKASVLFYEEVVGLVPEKVDEDFAIFWAGAPGQQQRLILLKRSLPPLGERGNSTAKTPDSSSRSVLSKSSPSDLGPTHFAFQVPRERLEEAVQHVRDSEIEVWGPVDFDTPAATSYYFDDPDGNPVEFWSPDPRE